MSLRTNESPRPIVNDRAAHDLLRAAHHTQYRFPERFTGFKASVTFASDGTSRGSVVVRAPSDIVLDLETDEQSSGWVRQEIASIAGHRWPNSYEQGDGRWTLTLGPDDGNALGRQVLMHDDPFSSSYRLRDGRITEVTRTMGTTRFSIITQQHLDLPDGRLLPNAFTVAYWDLERGRLTKTQAYTDAYVEVEGVWLPQSRRVVTMDDNGLTARQITFTDHQLLAGSASVITDVSARRNRGGA